MSANIKDIPATERIKRIRQEIVASDPAVCSERALIVTKSYQETEGQPTPIRRAKAIKRVLEEMTIHIWDNELIVGNHANGRRTAPIFPEWGVYWLEDQLDFIPVRPQDKMVIPDQVKADIRSVIPYWRGKTVYDKVWGTLPEEVQKARKALVFTVDLFERGSFGHTLYNTPKILKYGFSQVKQEALDQIKNADESVPEEFKKIQYWKAFVIICDGIIAFANRFSVLARELAEKEPDGRRKQELLEISGICARVPEYPAESFHEAVQAAWFLQLLPQLEGNGNSVSPGRLDQHLYPYYRKDIDEGKITNNDAQELLDCLWLKLNEIVKCWDTEAAKVHAGFPMTQTVTIGGRTREGKDATNELSYLFLNSQAHIRLGSPQFVVRVHAGLPEDFLMHICETIRGGGGMPALFGDEVITKSLLKLGMSYEEALDCGIVGCVEPSIIGAFGRNNGGFLNLARIVDFALNDGRDRLTGEQLGLHTGDPRNFTCIEDVMEAVKTQLLYFIKLLATEDHIIDVVQSELTPHVLVSTMIPGCIEKGKDITAGGAIYHTTTPFGAGLATATDSLAAIKKAVFEDKSVSMDELLHALDTDFEGMEGEKIRQKLLATPKFGNDDDYVDEFARFLTDTFMKEVETYESGRGGHLVGGFFTLSSTVPLGHETPATPNGRKARTPISDSVSPTNGVEENGPTAVLNSAAKIDHSRCAAGNAVNIKFSPGALESAGKLEKFANLITAYLIDMHGFEVQINVVSADTLRAAQKNPAEYRDLIIRIAGYSARFVELAPDIQEDLITRTEHQMV